MIKISRRNFNKKAATAAIVVATGTALAKAAPVKQHAGVHNVREFMISCIKCEHSDESPFWCKKNCPIWYFGDKA